MKKVILSLRKNLNKHVQIYIRFLILSVFSISQIIRGFLIKKQSLKEKTNFKLNVIGSANDWILSTIKEQLLLNKNLNNIKGQKINFYLHYSTLPFNPKLWFSLNHNILFFTHEDVKRYKPSFFYRKLYSFYDVIVCMNNNSNNKITKILLNNKKISTKVITNHFAGVSIEFANKAKSIKKKEFSKDGLIRLGFHCRPYSRKRPELLPKILKYLPNFKLICCGEDHNSLDIYKELISQDKVEFHNYKFDDLHLFYSQIDLLVCCSTFEGGPTPLVEANAFGIPFLSTDVGFAKEVASNFDKVIKVNSSEKLMSEALIEISKNIGLKPKQIVTWEKIVDYFHKQINKSLIK